MSRIGLEPIKIEEGINVTVNGQEIVVSNPNAEMKITLPEEITVEIKDNMINLVRKNEAKQSKSNHGTYRMLVANAIEGLKNGFTKTLELVGVGYRARLEGEVLIMSLGWNHPIKVQPYEGIEIEVPNETKIIIKGYNKQKVGEFAAKIRGIRKPEPYKGKGIRYEGEYVRRKSSKSSVAA
jgi:large subunit ribosomal protein L6